MPPDSDAEILRIRERLHELERSLAVVALFQSTLESNSRRLQELDEKMQAIATAEQVANAVAAKVNSIETARFTRWQTWGVRIAIAAAIIAGGKGVIELAMKIWGG